MYIQTWKRVECTFFSFCGEIQCPLYGTCLGYNRHILKMPDLIENMEGHGVTIQRRTKRWKQWMQEERQN